MNFCRSSSHLTKYVYLVFTPLDKVICKACSALSRRFKVLILIRNKGVINSFWDAGRLQGRYTSPTWIPHCGALSILNVLPEMFCSTSPHPAPCSFLHSPCISIYIYICLLGFCLSGKCKC